MKTYTIRLTENQLKLLQNMSEDWARVRMGQTFDLADDLAFQNYTYKKNDPEFDARIARRDECKDYLDKAMNAASGGGWEHWQKTDRVRAALDIWQVIRHFFWTKTPADKRLYDTVDAHVHQFGDEPLIEIEEQE